MFTDPRVKLSTNMKLELTNFEMKDKAIAKQAAFVLEELLQKVENNDEDHNLQVYQKYQVENKAIVLQKEKEELEKKYPLLLLTLIQVG